LAVFQKFFAAKEGDPGPIDEFSKIFLLVDQGVVVFDQFSEKPFPPFRPNRLAFLCARLGSIGLSIVVAWNSPNP